MEIPEENGQKYYRNVKYLQNAHDMSAAQNTVSAICGFANSEKRYRKAKILRTVSRVFCTQQLPAGCASGPLHSNKTEQLSVRLGAGGQLLCSVSYNIQF
ncbi:hypothetical protein [Enterocloster lavalensis]|uniref:hypothetical protein n=1 Tax=Enterocloster lavalensis TaxID=460384 RepID=UPI0023F0BB45|nr:hypothetical protein [Enterocloster lavalensis]